MSIQWCYFCVQDVEKLWYWMCLRHVSMLCHFCSACFSSCVPVFNRPVAAPHTGSSGLARFFDYDLYWGTRACLLCIFVPPPTVPLHYVVHSDSFLWAFTLFIYFRSMSGLSSEANFHFGALSYFKLGPFWKICDVWCHAKSTTRARYIHWTSCSSS